MSRDGRSSPVPERHAEPKGEVVECRAWVEEVLVGEGDQVPAVVLHATATIVVAMALAGRGVVQVAVVFCRNRSARGGLVPEEVRASEPGAGVPVVHIAVE